MVIDWQPRLAREDDIPRLEALVPTSAKKLHAHHYARPQVEAALGLVFDVDRQLIDDGTYFVVERAAQIIGCGGWSKRNSRFGGDSGRSSEDPLLNPDCDPARIRAFFVHPKWARRGIEPCILAECESAIQAAGFHFVELVATLTGEPFYAALGYLATERYEIPMLADLTLLVVRMTKHFGVWPTDRSLTSPR